MKQVPNLYSFATKELAQDATIAYLLAWAQPHLRDSHPRLNGLGTEFLQALLGSHSREAVVLAVTGIEVETQVDHIDVLARVNDEKCRGVVLVIEDKVGTHEHSNQIERYVEAARRNYPNRREVVPVYVKILNASEHDLPPKKHCGRFLREDFLRVLRRYCDTRDTIVDNFRVYLESVEERTNSYRHRPPEEWRPCCDPLPITGFYRELECRMPPEPNPIAQPHRNSPRWGYASNPAGGVHYFTFADSVDSTVDRGADKPVVLLQIEDATRLTVRLGEWSEEGKGIDPSFMYETLKLLEEESASRSGNFRIKKAGRFRGGRSAGVAEVSFEPGDSYLALSAQGLVDMDRTMERLERMREVVVGVAKRYPRSTTD